MQNKQIVKKDFQFSTVVGGELPFGSGFGANFNDDPVCRQNLRKSHTLGSTTVQPAAGDDLSKYAPHTRYDFSAGMSFDSTLHNTLSSSAYGARFRSQVKDSRPPVVEDDTVLRFLGFSRETVLESSDETVRVRKLALLFHCQDETILLREAAQINSGIQQGVVLKRQRVPKKFLNNEGASFTSEKAEHLRVHDLVFGEGINIFGRIVFLVDCTHATKNYLRDVCGREDVPETALPWPENDDTYNNKQVTKLRTHAKRQLPVADFDNKRALESIGGSGVVSKHAPDQVRTAQQFLKNKIGEHLQFAAYWDDRGKLSGDFRLCVIRYYLENDTVEVVEHRGDNCGREGGNVLLCRQRVSIPGKPAPNGSLTGTVQQNTYGLLLKDGFLTFNDLHIGMDLVLFGVKYHTYDVDSFTREWYKREQNIDLGEPEDISHIAKKFDKPPPVQYPPAHTGFGTEEDSLQSWKSLMLKPPKIDVMKQARENGKVMLFRAEFANATAPEDVGREFLISFYRATDEVEIVERQIRNAGIVGGKFLAKSRHLKVLPDGRRVPYTPEDFIAGEVVKIAGRNFKLLEMDGRSKRQCENDIDEVSEQRVKELIVALRELLNGKYCRLHEAYRALAPDGILGPRELKEFFWKSSGEITDEEAMFLAAHFAPPGEGGNGYVSYAQFVKMMDPGNTHNMDEAANSVRAVRGVTVAPRGSETGQLTNEVLLQKTESLDSRIKAERLRKLLVGKLVQRRGTVQEAFRLMAGHSANAKLYRAQLEEGMRHTLHLELSPADTDLLCNLIFPTPESLQRGIDFTAFSIFVGSC